MTMLKYIKILFWIFILVKSKIKGCFRILLVICLMLYCGSKNVFGKKNNKYASFSNAFFVTKKILIINKKKPMNVFN